VVRLRDEHDTTRKRLGVVTGQLLEFEAVALADAAGGKPVAVVRDDLGLDDARLLARLLSERGVTAIVGVGGARAQVVLMRPAVATAPDCGKVLREVLAGFGGKGGGQPQAAQGGVPDRAGSPKPWPRFWPRSGRPGNLAAPRSRTRTHP
jgi:alanyl-tRNA synthetase